MPQSRPKRDNDYYLQRLRDDFPAIYADYLAGKFKNAAAAIVAAGLRRPKSGLDHLHAAWKKASAPERNTFKVQIGCAGSGTTTGVQTNSSSPPAPSSPARASAAGATRIHTDGYLSKGAIAHIATVMARRSMKIGDVMAEMGFKKLNPSVGLAMNQGSQIRDLAVLTALETWLNGNPA